MPRSLRCGAETNARYGHTHKHTHPIDTHFETCPHVAASLFCTLHPRSTHDRPIVPHSSRRRLDHRGTGSRSLLPGLLPESSRSPRASFLPRNHIGRCELGCCFLCFFEQGSVTRREPAARLRTIACGVESQHRRGGFVGYKTILLEKRTCFLVSIYSLLITEHFWGFCWCRVFGLLRTVKRHELGALTAINQCVT